MLDDISLKVIALATLVAMFVYACLFIGWKTARTGRLALQAIAFVLIAAMLGWYLLVDAEYTATSTQKLFANFLAVTGLTTLVGFVAYFVMRSATTQNQYRVRKGGLQAVGAVFAYIIGHTFVGFGIPEASMSAAIAAVSLGLMGFQA